jgi:hypothetical protein
MHSVNRFTRIAAGSMLLASSLASALPFSLAAQGVKPVTPPAAAKVASTTDPRVGLKAGLYDAASSIKGLKLVSTTPKSATLDGEGGARGLTFANSDLAFKAPYVYQGNFSGFQIWNMSNPSKPTLTAVEVCGTGQGDPSVWGNLLFVSSEGTGNRTDCGTQGVTDKISTDRMVGVRIYDISDPAHPKKVKDVQTCRGSHTHTLIPDPKDKGVVYVYVSGSAGVRPEEELAGCKNLPQTDVNGALFRIEIIKVELAHPENAKVVGFGRIFDGLAPISQHGLAPSDVAPAPAQAPAGAAPAPTGPNQCHDITLYPEMGMGAGACGGYGILIDLKDPLNPKRLQAVGDTNFAFWHSATFNNDASKLLFTDEWGGGTSPKCRADDPIDWGADAIFTLKNRKLTQGAFFKMPAAQTKEENCVAHNGGLIPVPGRDIMVQGWYQGGLDLIDFTDAAHPYEMAYFDRGPVDAAKLVTAGYWGAYYYNGLIYASEIARGVDVLELAPSEYLSQNEIDAAKLVTFEQFNPQLQPKITWPAAFPVVRSFVDQLVRGSGIAPARSSAINAAIDAAEKASGTARKTALDALAADLAKDATSAKDGARVKMLIGAVKNLSAATK